MKRVRCPGCGRLYEFYNMSGELCIKCATDKALGLKPGSWITEE